MKNFLESMMGKEIEVITEGGTIIGKVTRIDGDVLFLEKDEVTCYINIQKIAVVWDAREKRANPPGFMRPELKS